MAQALSPDQVIASDAFHDYQAKNLPGMSRGPAFERFTVGQVALRRQELGLSDIESGICGDKNDGGIDGFRRRFQYRGTTAPASKVRTVTDLAQAVMAYRLLEPDTARARPRSLPGTRHGWDRVFDSNQSEVLFSKALEVAEAVDLYLKTPGAKAIADDATNGRHYLVAGYALRSSNVKTLVDFNNVPTAALIATPSTPALKEIHELLYSEVKKLDDGKIARDQIFKGTKLKSGFFAEILKLNA